MFLPNDKLVLAVSGGIDSMVLLELCLQLGNPIIVCHVNHGLRGDQSDADEKFVKDYCATQNIGFFSKNIGDELQSIEQGNMHDIARNLRYAFFNTILLSQEADYILTGHHQDDLIEGSIHNLIRGTGLRGLTGIKSKREHILRPLIDVSKSNINAFATEHKIPFREDPSNSKSVYNRNKIRHELLPLLDDILPNSRNRILKTLKNLSNDFDLLQSFLEREAKIIRTYHVDGININKDKLSTINGVPSVLFYILEPYGFRRTQVENVLNGIDNIGIKIKSSTHILSNERSQLVLDSLESNLPDVQVFIERGHYSNVPLSTNLRIEIEEKENVSAISRDYDACFDIDKLQFPLTIRKWKEGESFKPIGMDGKSKKVSKYLRDQKVDTRTKENNLVMVSGEEICWVIPSRISEDFKTDNQTKTILCIKCSITK